VGQWLVFGWLGGWGTWDMQLARRKLGLKKTSQSWQLPSPYGRHGALPPAPPHTRISQHAARQVYVVKTREYYCFCHLLAILRHNPSLTCHACVFSQLQMIETRDPNQLNQKSRVIEADWTF
jgi:hypothetical protein